jgi:hypothetical protein
MKRCPECQFLYEDESVTCDMDGTALRYTVKLPTLPGLAQSIWDKWTIAMLFAVVMVTVLVILYRAAPAAYTSTAAGQMTPVNNEKSVSGQERPSANSEASPESSPEEPATEASETDSGNSSEAPSNDTGTKGPRSKRGSPAEAEKEPTPAPFIHVQAATNSPAVKASSPTDLTTIEIKSAESSAGQKAAAAPASSANSNHPLPPEVMVNKANPQTQKKDSGFKSIFKKAGKILKKPFGEK